MMNNSLTRGKLTKINIWLFLGLLLKVGFFLQLYFLLSIAMLLMLPPWSTTFERSQAYSHLFDKVFWQQDYIPYVRIADTLKRAVIASEDGTFLDHSGVDWDALEKAAERNAIAEEKAEKLASKSTKNANIASAPKIVGGSTITQQLAKNLYLSGERNLFRKGQEVLITFGLELFLTKPKILEIYLNHVEWGNAIFGAEAAAKRYYSKSANALTAAEAAKLAVMLPRPRYFENKQNSAWLKRRTRIIQGCLQQVQLP